MTVQRSSLTYAVIGTGAIGGYYGACLQRAGCTVHFLLHRDYAQVQAHGLRVESIAGDFALPQVNAYAHVADMPPVDVVIIGLKTTQNALLKTLLPPLLGPQTVVLTLQNGLNIEAEIAAIAPQSPIFGGLCFICSNKVGPGHIRHLDYGAIALGAYVPEDQPGGVPPQLSAIAADFKAAGIETEVVEDLYMTRWRKLVWNIPFNSLSVVLNATTQEMMADPNVRQLAQDLMTEVVAAAAACGNRGQVQGRSLPPEIVSQMLDHTATMKPYRTSMKIDYDEGRPLEVEAILGNPLRSAQAAGLATPRIDTLYRLVKACDRQPHRPSP
ncbi:MAG: putative 2-dehydropantoate 2-reductase [Leptolyngbyaceae cyanobacterium T60_A2020_046]|nr:putative 2-dehydropantoate 2-reductase [Leptolyngbyaceae cyanobacterium T60_A2020_046]